MSHVVRESSDPRKTHRGRARCGTCKTVYDFGPRDVRYHPNMWGGEHYLYLECPNEYCRKPAILKDYRYLGLLWRNLMGPPMVTLAPTDPS